MNVNERTMEQPSSPVDTEEIGAQDNVLMVDPTDERFAPTIAKWTDNGVYRGVMVDVRQVSPGQFEVMAMRGGKPEGQAEEQEPEAEPEAPEPPEMGGEENPAMARMLA